MPTRGGSHYGRKSHVHGVTKTKHGEHCENVLRVIQAEVEQRQMSAQATKVSFYDNQKMADGLEPDPDKAEAIWKMSTPENVT